MVPDHAATHSRYPCRRSATPATGRSTPARSQSTGNWSAGLQHPSPSVNGVPSPTAEALDHDRSPSSVLPMPAAPRPAPVSWHLSATSKVRQITAPPARRRSTTTSTRDAAHGPSTPGRRARPPLPALRRIEQLFARYAAYEVSWSVLGDDPPSMCAGTRGHSPRPLSPSPTASTDAHCPRALVYKPHGGGRHPQSCPQGLGVCPPATHRCPQKWTTASPIPCVQATLSCVRLVLPRPQLTSLCTCLWITVDEGAHRVDRGDLTGGRRAVDNWSSTVPPIYPQARPRFIHMEKGHLTWEETAFPHFAQHR
ncbi:hypothetical protein OJAG_30520 [Oerskovia enterophila]|uniref:Uncharacterized protein n=1 Tax=Oerskovia enterophila TaxID=43678 RepID=A0A163QJ83_9CELL|nr:hypothetical protein OJAG_30520 [Oerskovia enterophila]